MTRSSTSCKGSLGAVAGGAKEAVNAGLRMLSAGGNAADAAVAVILAEAVTDYGRFAWGGEAPWMWHDGRTGQVRVLQGIGRAPSSPEAVERLCRDGIPYEGSLLASPVPAAPDLCMTALANMGTFRLGQVAQPALELLAKQTEPWHEALGRCLQRLVRHEESAGSREEGLQKARDAFYRGDIAVELAEWYRKAGGLLTRDDLARHETQEEEPVSIHWEGHRIFKCGPWTQGPLLLEALEILREPTLGSSSDASSIHRIVESLKLALADRDAWFADPEFFDYPWSLFWSENYARARRGLIDPFQANPEFRPGDPRDGKVRTPAWGDPPGEGGTTTCAVADRWGNVVAATPSANPPYSLCPALGLAHGNRLRCLNTLPGHPNSLEPGKRPRITLTPSLVRDDSGRVTAISVAGADLQEQATLQILLRLVVEKCTPAEAVSLPRWSSGHHEHAFRPFRNRSLARENPNLLRLEPRFPDTLEKELAALGHQICRVEGPGDRPVLAHWDPGTGTLLAAADPRTSGHAGAVDSH